jgi:excinuclease ABC subunit A
MPQSPLKSKVLPDAVAPVGRGVVSSTTLSVRGAREHNLKNIDVDIPKNQLTVITGVSGSGKSSLAFDTIYAEGQRRYVESLSSYARQFLQLMEKPDLDHIDGLSPAISIDQKTTSRNPRSTVGTVTEIYDYLRLLFARVGVPHSPATGLPIARESVSQMADRIETWPEGKRILILAPVVRDRKGTFVDLFQDLRKKGFVRLRINGKQVGMDEIPALKKTLKHDIEVVVDRLVLGGDIRTRLVQSLETATKLSEGILWVLDADSDEKTVFSEHFSCPESGFALDDIEPRLFSFNSPHGACATCDGLGVRVVIDPRRIVPDPSLSLNDGAIAPWAGKFHSYYDQTLASVAKHFGARMTTPFEKLPKGMQHALIYGTEMPIAIHYNDGFRAYKTNKPFPGLVGYLEKRYQANELSSDDQERYCVEKDCDACGGTRLNEKALCVKIAGNSIAGVTALSIGDAYLWIAETLPPQLGKQDHAIADRILREIRERLSFLNNVGLSYLTLHRHASTLSGGENQRIRLASQIGCGLSGVLYVLDEPSIGLHQRDNDRLLETLRNLRDLGNTVLVVEHDEDAMRTADYLIDMGPRAGRFGGEVVAAGTPDVVIAHPKSLTGAYLRGDQQITPPATRRKGNGKTLSLRGVHYHNLQNVNVDIPLGTLTCVTGVSGSGKSSLVMDSLYQGMLARFWRSDLQRYMHSIEGGEWIDKVIEIDQSPIGRTPRSNPITYIGAFTPIRDWFAALPEAKARGYAVGRFSFNVKGGRCEACQGDGLIKIEMHFLPDVYVECETCKGKRYNRETLDVTYRDKSIADVLQMSVEEALSFFHPIPAVRDKIKLLQDIGLDYIQLGQAANTLSGGEAQRIKLAKELTKRATGRTLYILDEPTTGLHFEDVRKLLAILQQLVDQGNTVVVIEHNLDVIACADWIIDLGPEGGSGGGHIIAAGTPEDVIKNPKSYTGQYLGRKVGGR